MNKEQAMNVAIGEYLGLKGPFRVERVWLEAGQWAGWRNVLQCDNGNHVPNYTGSLDAIHEAEKVLRGKILPDMDGHPSLDAWTWFGHMLAAESEKKAGDRSWHATALQRATALIATLNLQSRVQELMEKEGA